MTYLTLAVLCKIEVVQISYFTHGELKLSLLLEVTCPDVDRNVNTVSCLRLITIILLAQQ
jgi:hypothetical protein